MPTSDDNKAIVRRFFQQLGTVPPPGRSGPTYLSNQRDVQTSPAAKMPTGG